MATAKSGSLFYNQARALLERTPGFGITQDHINRVEAEAWARSDHDARQAQLDVIRRGWVLVQKWRGENNNKGTVPRWIFNDNYRPSERQLEADVETLVDVLQGIVENQARKQLGPGSAVITPEHLATMLRKRQEGKITSAELDTILGTVREATEEEQEALAVEDEQARGYSTKKQKRKRKRETKKQKRKRETKKQKRKRDEEKRARAHSRKKAKRRSPRIWSS